MKKVFLALLGLILLAILSFFCFQDKASTIRETLVSTTTSALEADNITGVTANLKGSQYEMTDVMLLTGEVPTQEAKAKAETIARAIEGIGGVENQLTVNKQVAAVIPEAEIVAGTNKINPYTLTILKDENNKVTLNGYVEDASQQKKLVEKAHALFGSDNVTDNTTIAENAPQDWEHISSFALDRLKDVDYGDMKLSNQSYEFTGHLPSPSTKAAFLDGIREVMANPENKYSKYRGDYIITAPIEEVKVAQKEASPQTKLAAQTKSAPKVAIATIDNCQNKIDILTQTNKVLFDYNKATIAKNSYTLMNDIVTALKQCNASKLEVGGHTDATGSESYNKRLSKKRALSVKAYLTKKEIPAENIIAVGYGETNPIASNDNKEGRTKNRRIEFTIKGVK